MTCCLTPTSLPTVSVLVLLAWSYYAYVVELCTYTIESAGKLTSYAIIYHLLLFMVLWTYFKTMCANIAVVPADYRISRTLYEKIKMADSDKARNDFLLAFCQDVELEVITRNSDGYIRFCKKCKHVKPDRAHHCSQCGTCILKMDHHCPWLNNCIGFSNYKYFVLFLCYTSLYCIFYAGTTLEYFIVFWKESVKTHNGLHVVIGFIIALSFCIIVSAFSCYHLSLISRNETTLEAINETTFRDNNENLTFDVGTSQNFEEVFGERYILWFIPVWTSLGDGFHFPVKLIF